METNRRVISSIITETKHQALWLASLKAGSTEVTFDIEHNRWVITYYEEA